MTCTRCGQEIDWGAAFCGSCGQPVAAAPGAAATAAAPTPATSSVAAPQPAPPASPQPAPLTPPAAPATYAPIVGAPAYSTAAAAPGPAYGLPAQFARPGGAKAIAALVLGLLALVAWLIPIIGLIIAVTGLVLGSMSTHSAHRALAIIGIVLSVIGIGLAVFGGIYNLQHAHLKSSAGATSASLQAITTPCYTTKLDSGQKVTQAAGSCNLKTSNSAGDDNYQVGAFSEPQLTTADLITIAQKDSQNVISQNSGSSITAQRQTEIAGSPAYVVTLSDGNGGTATLDYLLHASSAGFNLFVVDRFVNQGGSSLGDVESNWVWK